MITTAAQPRVKPTSLRSEKLRRETLQLVVIFKGSEPAPFGGSRKRWAAKNQPAFQDRKLKGNHKKSWRNNMS